PPSEPPMMSARRRGMQVLKLATQLPVERTGAAAANEEIERDQQQKERVLEPSCGPEEALGRGDPDGVDHEDKDRERGRTGEQSKDEQETATRLGQPHNDGPEQARLVADIFEDGGEPCEAGAAEPAEQLLASVRDEDRAEADAQRDLRAGREPLVN